MLSGVLFVIGIPTESEENQIRINNGLLPFASSSIKKPITSSQPQQQSQSQSQSRSRQDQDIRRSTSFKINKNTESPTESSNGFAVDQQNKKKKIDLNRINSSQKKDLLKNSVQHNGTETDLGKDLLFEYGTFSTEQNNKQLKYPDNKLNNEQIIINNRNPMVKFNEPRNPDDDDDDDDRTLLKSPSSKPLRSSSAAAAAAAAAIVTATINTENEINKRIKSTTNKILNCSSITNNDNYNVINDTNVNVNGNVNIVNPSLNIASDAPMELVMIEMIKKIQIQNVIWQKSKTEQFYQIQFTLELDSQRYNQILILFSEWGIGERNGSFLSIVPCSMYYHKMAINDLDSMANGNYDCAGGGGGGGGGLGGGDGRGGSGSDRGGGATGADDNDVMMTAKQSAWNRFVNSTRARFNVAQIILEVKQDAQLTFDFVTCLIVAGILAAFGLIESSTIFLASSMLISPLMGPIIATIFGTVVKDRQLVQIGFVNEMIGILLATFVGFLFGLLVYSIDGGGGGYGDSDNNNNGMLTMEMLSRCEFHSLIIGIFTALPSGAAVAIAILGENIGSLVGVAISASLLPPAVNAGLIWGLSILNLLHQNDDKYKLIVKTLYWTDNQPMELLILGSISMLLTIINVICIYVMGIIFLKIKEVAPIVSPNHRQFWKYDIKAARDFMNKSSFDEEFAEFENVMDTELSYLVAEQQLQLRNLNRPSYQSTWSPMTNHRYLLNGGTGGSNSTAIGLRRDSRSSMHINVPSAVQQQQQQLHQQFDYNYPSMNHHPNPIQLLNQRKLSVFGGSGSYKTIIGKSWSPPHKSILYDQIFPSDKFNKLRRTSMPGFNQNHHLHQHPQQHQQLPTQSQQTMHIKSQFIPMSRNGSTIPLNSITTTSTINNFTMTAAAALTVNTSTNPISLLTNTLRNNNTIDYGGNSSINSTTSNGETDALVIGSNNNNNNNNNNKLEKITEATQSQLRRAQSISSSCGSTSLGNENEGITAGNLNLELNHEPVNSTNWNFQLITTDPEEKIVKNDSTTTTTTTTAKKRKKFIVTSISESHLNNK